MRTRRIFVPVAIAAALILLLSMALGWHYAVDGIVGASVTLACYQGLLAFYRSRSGAREHAPALALG
ncbi:phosphatase PAP2 family protein [Stakelama marina]|uniref:Phosphatase PAP2 family protein n=1 Tax=Stakelama marina TaxID=2826939 RepID=A0A8T4ILL6_9SPHN|nr:phosphatase PAP2 family protein [Stakelama marina]MBR0553239.1 phosphatase PAP2 family protein [Stakelama marina]